MASPRPPYSLPHRPADSHKGRFGTVLVIGGSARYAGALALAAEGAGRSGAGLIQAAAPRRIAARVAAQDSRFIIHALPETAEGVIAFAALRRLRDLISSATALVIGPGMGTSTDLADLLSRLLAKLAVPVVLDADALNLLAATGLEPLNTCAAPKILTPHPGEAARLLGVDIASIQRGREDAAKELVRRTGAVVVLKGHRSVVTDGTEVFVNTTGNSGLATGGTGDVLAGLIGGLLAQGASPMAAASIGVHCHGAAAAALEAGGQAFGASPVEVARALPAFLAGFVQ